MSDLVRYVVGNTKGRDHQMWPTILRSEIPAVLGALTEDEIDALYPVDITLDQIMALALQVKKWRLTGSADATYTLDEPTAPHVHIDSSMTATLNNGDLFNLIDGNIEEGDPAEIAAKRERDLLFRAFSNTYRCLVNNGTGPLVGGVISSFDVSTFETTDSGSSDFSYIGSTPDDAPGALAPRIFNGFVLFDDNTKLFSPMFVGLGEIIRGSNSSQFSMMAQFAKTPVTVSSGVSPIGIKGLGALTVKPHVTDDFVIPIQLSFALIGQGVGNAVSGFVEGDFTLEALEFWPYETSKGEPVRNTSTGQLIGGDVDRPFR